MVRVYKTVDRKNLSKKDKELSYLNNSEIQILKRGMKNLTNEMKNLIIVVIVGFIIISTLVVYSNISLGQKIDALVTNQAFSNSINSIGQSVVQVNSFYLNHVNQGTGFVIAKNDYILTTSHNVDGNPLQVNVTLLSGDVLSATIVETSFNNLDLAILKVDAQLKPVKIIHDTSSVSAGQEIGLIGHVYGFTKQVVSQGIISFFGFENDIKTMRINALISPGESGSPVFLSNTGNVIAVYAGSLKISLQPINSSTAPTPEARYIVDILGQYISDVVEKTAQTGVGSVIPIDDSILSGLPS